MDFSEYDDFENVILALVCDMTHVCETSHIYLCGVAHLYMRFGSGHIANVNEEWHMCICDSSFIFVMPETIVNEKWHICKGDMARAYMCDVSHLNMRHPSFMCVTWRICICDMVCVYVCFSV